MDDLIKALTILRKYGNPNYPTACAHDELIICGINPLAVSAEDIETLDQLGFFIDTDDECFKSFRFGSA